MYAALKYISVAFRVASKIIATLNFRKKEVSIEKKLLFYKSMQNGVHKLYLKCKYSTYKNDFVVHKRQ